MNGRKRSSNGDSDQRRCGLTSCVHRQSLTRNTVAHSPGSLAKGEPGPCAVVPDQAFPSRSAGQYGGVLPCCRPCASSRLASAATSPTTDLAVAITDRITDIQVGADRPASVGPTGADTPPEPPAAAHSSAGAAPAARLPAAGLGPLSDLPAETGASGPGFPRRCPDTTTAPQPHGTRWPAP